MANKRDYYEILGVSKGADAKEIKKAYVSLVKKYHPDKSEGDSSKFKEVQNAYPILSDPNKLNSYKTQTQGDSRGFGKNRTYTYEDLFRQAQQQNSQKKSQTYIAHVLSDLFEIRPFASIPQTAKTAEFFQLVIRLTRVGN